MTQFNFAVLAAAPTRAVAEHPTVQVLADLVNAAPRSLGIKEIIAVAVASGIALPAETTVRNYLNIAAKDGRISKPSRQSYGKAGAPVEDDSDEASNELPEDADLSNNAPDDAAAFDAEDPLAGL